MVILSKFAETLGDLMFEQKIDGKTLAARIGVEGSTVTRYLRTDRAPTVENLLLLADYFQCSTDFLLGREAENHTHTFPACPPFSVQIGRVLQHFGCSFYRLSVEAKIHQSSVYDWKSGKREPTLDNIVKIAEFFDCTVDFVLGREV
jgi:hypothetical protein